jgi:CheY-like chemotaxis protein
VLIQVSDTGTGIPASVIDRIFDPFFTTKDVGKGTGLGLSTVLGIVKSHGGVLVVESDVGRGTTFSIYLPLAPETTERDEAATPVAVPRGRGETILLVDNEEEIRSLAAEGLRTYGYEVITARDGIEGCATFAEHRKTIKLVLTDLDMPGMEGLPMVRVIRKMEPSIRVILCSGLFGRELKKLTPAELEVFGRSTLPKPYTMDGLVGTVRRVLDEKG